VESKKTWITEDEGALMIAIASPVGVWMPEEQKGRYDI